MSLSVRYLPILAVAAVLGSVLLLALGSMGCPGGTGACTYDDNPAVEGETQIVSVVQDPNSGFYRVRFEGLITREVDMAEETYRNCIEGQGYFLGTSIPATSISGGPCPPIETIGACGLP